MPSRACAKPVAPSSAFPSKSNSPGSRARQSSTLSRPRARRAPRRRTPRRRRASSRDQLRVSRECLPRRDASLFLLQLPSHRARAPRRRSSLSTLGAVSCCRTAFGRRFRAGRRPRQFHARAARLRQADGNGLLRRTRSVLSFADVMDFLAHELARLCDSGLSRHACRGARASALLVPASSHLSAQAV